MTTSRRTFMGIAAATAMTLAAFGPAHAENWREKYPTVTLGVITAENEADKLARYEPVLAYFKEALGTDVKWRTATDYAGVIEGQRAGMIQIGRHGPASYSQAWLVMNGEIEPLVAELDAQGGFGYHAVVLVKSDSTYKSLQDLKGKKFALVDPNSTSGNQAPRFFLKEDGIDVDQYFSNVGFTGSHENAVMSVLNGTYDAAANWWTNEERSNYLRMVSKDMIPADSMRIVWKSPLMPSSPWAMSTKLPQAMRDDVRKALIEMPTRSPEAWKALTDGKSIGFREVTHKDYEPIVRMIKENQRARRAS